MKPFIITTFLLLSGWAAIAQHTLSLNEYLNIVRKYHPVAKQASLGIEIAKADVTSARGAFDPRFENSISRKEFEGLLYYDHQVTELKVPTWYGVEVVAGMENLNGQRTSTPDTKGNSSYIGFSIPVAKGLLLDERRATLQQAKIFQRLSIQEQQAIINDLVYDATKAYLAWWQYSQLQRLYQQATFNANQRFQLVRTAYQIGERPAIDTLEALAQLQSIQMKENEIQVEAKNALLEVNNFLWQQNNDVYNLPAKITPDTSLPAILKDRAIEQLLDNVQAHPELQQYRLKLETLEVEKKLKFQSLLPSVYLKYNQLTKSHSLEKTLNTPWLQNNFRYGIAVSMPLRLSAGRGEYRQAKLKIQQTELQRINKQVSLQIKVQQYHNEWKQLQQQIQMQQQSVQLYTSLLKGEEIKFNNGESSLFLVNAREFKVVEAKQNLIKLESKERQVASGIFWASGIRVNE